MKIRICSDLHCDVNQTFTFGFNNKLDKVDLNIIAGDIAGDAEIESTYLNKLQTKKPVVCVGGNHLGYNYLYKKDINNILKGTKEQSLNELTNNFKGPIYYLENSDILVNGKIVFGGTMYTDFKLYGDDKLYGECAERGLNDFRYVYTNQIDVIRPVHYTDYINWFNLFLYKLEKRIKETKEDNLDIIVVTHFAPSKKSISKKYNGIYRNLNPAYASNLQDFIQSNPRIKLWVHGHMHDSFDYKIGQCRVVCYPYGYQYDNIISSKEYEGKIIRLK